MAAERYEGAVGLERLKAHMCLAFAERKHGAGAGWSPDYFHGWLRGLAIADGIGPEIAVAANDFVRDRGFERAWSKPSPEAMRAIATLDVDAAADRLASIRRKVEGGSLHATGEDLQRAEFELDRARSFLDTLPASFAAPAAP
jgi:hypothetical protein